MNTRNKLVKSYFPRPVFTQWIQIQPYAYVGQGPYIRVGVVLMQGCYDIDECETGRHSCKTQINETCSNTEGSFTCPCKGTLCMEPEPEPDLSAATAQA
eukprot:3013480-Rhodomonas_salina.1